MLRDNEVVRMKPQDIRIEVDLKGTTATIRMITPADKEIEVEFVRNLSAESRYYRFHSALKELTPRQIDQFTTVQFPDTMALIATIRDDDVEKEIAVARYSKFSDQNAAAEVAIVVADEWQGMGLGTGMLLELRNIAAMAGIRTLHMNVLSENHRMIKLAHRLGFHTEPITDDYTSQQLGKNVSQDEG